MTKSQVTYPQAIEKARQAEKRGDREQARYWAEYAAAAAPELETAWLLLGDLAGLQKRVEYYTRAVEANPSSKNARQRLGTAVKQLRRSQSISAQELLPNIRLGVPFASTIQRKTSMRAAFLLVIAVASFGLAAWVGISALPALADTTAGMFSTETPQVLLANRVNPLTPTPTPTATSTPTPTPTPTLTPTPTPRPTRSPTATPQPVYSQRPWYIGGQDFWLEIDLGDQQMIARRGDEVLRTFLISSGKWPTLTPTGTFQIHKMVYSQTMAGSDFYLPDVPFVMYFYKDYAVHGAYWHTNFGTQMSHGCVNMEPGDAGWVYQAADIGTWVIIHY